MNKTELINRIELYNYPVKLKEPFIISLGKLEYADNFIVVIKTGGGITGFGECSPFQTIHGETGETCMAVGKILAKKLIGENALDIAHCSLLMDSVIFGNTSVKSAFDIALHDIAAQNSGMPLYRFLGGENNKEIFTDYTVSLGTPQKMASDAKKISDEGYPVIKVKLGGKEGDDMLRMEAIREKVGNEIPIRIDANQGWNVETAIRILTQLEKFNIQHCEEPIPRYSFMELPEVRKKSKIPIMADESCCDHHDAVRLIKLNACDSLNIKLGKSSGIIKAKKIIELAEKANLKIQIGGFLESRLGFTASAHLALCSKNIVYFDFDTPLMFSSDHVVDGIAYSSNGRVSVPDKNGLGASFSIAFLKTLKSVVIT